MLYKFTNAKTKEYHIKDIISDHHHLMARNHAVNYFTDDWYMEEYSNNLFESVENTIKRIKNQIN